MGKVAYLTTSQQIIKDARTIIPQDHEHTAYLRKLIEAYRQSVADTLRLEEAVHSLTK